MDRRRKVAAIAVAGTAVLLLAGCNKITRQTLSAGPASAGCFEHTLSGDGKWMVFTTSGEPGGSIPSQKTILRDLSTGKNRELAGNPSHTEDGTAVSDDGSRVLVSTYQPDSGVGLIRQLNLWTRTSGKRTSILPAGEGVGDSAISGDGRKVLYNGEDGLTLYDVGTGTRKLVPIPAALTNPAGPDIGSVSKTGRHVAIAGNEKIWSIDTSTGAATLLPTTKTIAGNPSMSSDGRYVAFEAHIAKPTSDEVYVWDRTTGTVTQVSHSPAQSRAWQPSISGDGTRIAYTTHTFFGTTTATLSVWTRTTGSTVTAATAHHSFHAPSLSNDGHLMSFCTSADTLVKGSPLAPNMYTWSG